jgi:hypothetical protein
MRDLKLEDKQLKIGNTSFNKESLQGLTETQFKKRYKGIINIDLDVAWKKIRGYTKKSK